MIGWTRDDPVTKTGHAGIQRRIWIVVARLIPRLRDLAVTICIEHSRTPSLRPLLVTGLVVEPGVQPADDIAVAAEPERVILVLTKLQVVRTEARINEHELFVGRVVERGMTTGTTDRIVLSELVI